MPQTLTSHNDYGEALFGAPWFSDLFPHFEEHQAIGAKVLIDRIFARCGLDPDLPYVDRIIYFGCGDGSLLKYLIECWEKNESCKGRDLKVRAFDTSEVCVKKASLANSGPHISLQCESSLANAFNSIPAEEWNHAAVIILGHTWFHLNQDDAIKELRKYRPALLLIDIHQKWDYAVAHLPYTEGYASSDSANDSGGKRKKYSLRTELEGDKSVRRSIFADEEAVFCTIQAKVSTRELLGLSNQSEGQPPNNGSECLLAAKNAGTLTGGADYVCRRRVPHESGWGMMDCYCLVPRDPVATLLNDAYATVLEGLISETIAEELYKPSASSKRASSEVSAILRMFDEPELLSSDGHDVTGCRIAVGILPFDINLTFCKFFPLFKTLAKNVRNFELLAENPSPVQERFPSAYGVYQTLLSRSSCPQAFTLKWASDYDHTTVDRAFERIEEEAIGISALREIQDKKCITLIDDKNPPSFFMVPIYCGSLPLFAIALKFPAFFDPARTGFDVFLSTVSSLHDSIKVLLNPDRLRQNIVRPWIENCLLADWSQAAPKASPEEKLQFLENYLFGHQIEQESPLAETLAYRLGDNLRISGVLSKEWKSWILGLPSFPIKKMAKTIEENRRLWKIWENEKEISLLDPALRISLWFQDGKFFEDKAHEHFDCSVHLPRLREMFADLEVTQIDGQAWNFSNAVNSLRKNYKDESSNISRYFGKENTQYFLFRWPLKQLTTLAKAETSCECQTACSAAGSLSICSCAAQEAFDALKAVFCKTNANTGRGVRFDLIRLWHLIDAARTINAGPPAGTLTPSTPRDLNEIGRQLPSKFWSEDDPSIHIAEFVQCLARMGCPGNPNCSILDQIQLSIKSDVTIALSLKIELKDNVGGSEKHKLDQCAKQIRKHCTLGDIHGAKEIKIQFSVTPEGEFKPVSEEES